MDLEMSAGSYFHVTCYSTLREFDKMKLYNIFKSNSVVGKVLTWPFYLVTLVLVRQSNLILQKRKKNMNFLHHELITITFFVISSDLILFF
jgi:hypothetical protein